MRLITQNIFMCNVNKCIAKEVPLLLKVGESQVIECSFDKAMVAKTL